MIRLDEEERINKKMKNKNKRGPHKKSKYDVQNKKQGETK